MLPPVSTASVAAAASAANNCGSLVFLPKSNGEISSSNFQVHNDRVMVVMVGTTL